MDKRQIEEAIISIQQFEAIKTMSPSEDFTTPIRSGERLHDDEPKSRKFRNKERNEKCFCKSGKKYKNCCGKGKEDKEVNTGGIVL